MSVIRVDTDKVYLTSNKINTINGQIRDEFADVVKTVQNLDSSWDGDASTTATRAFAKIKNDFADSRYKAMNNFVKFLNQQVDEGYEQTEQANTNLADAFK